MFKKRSHLKLLSILGISLLTSIGVITGISFGNKSVEKASAEATTKTIYCKMEHSWWTKDGAAVGVHYWGTGITGTDWPGVRMTSAGTNLWKYDVPLADGDNPTNVIFTRVNNSGDISDWGAKTTDLEIPTDGRNLFTIDSKEVWGNPGCSGSWSKYVPDGWYLVGDFNGWIEDDNSKMTYDSASDQYYKKQTMTLDQQFKIVNWYQGTAYWKNYDEHEGGPSSAFDTNQIVRGDDDSGYKFKCAIPADYDVYWKAGTGNAFINRATYSIKYDPNGGSGTAYSDYINIQDQGTVQTCTFTPGATKKFKEWNTKADGTGMPYAPGSKVSKQQQNTEFKLYAIWRDKVPADGYYLEGKFYDSTKGEFVTNRIALTNDGTQYLVENITLTKGDHFKVAYYSDESIDPNKYAGYDQLENAAGSARYANQLIDGNAHDIEIKYDGTYTLYFHDDRQTNKIWIPKITYSVKYLPNGGTGTETTDTFDVGIDTNAKPGDTFTPPSSKRFKEWNTNALGGGTSYAAGAAIQNRLQGTLELYAIWESAATPVTMTFNTQGGTHIDPISGMSGSSYTKPNDPTKEHFTFNGWNPTLPNVMPANDTTYTAQWTMIDGVYLTGSFANWSRDATYNMIRNEQAQSATEYMVTVTLQKDDEIRPYRNVGDDNWYDIKSIDAYDPDYVGWSNSNCKVNADGEYTVYFDTTSGKLSVSKEDMPSLRRFFVICNESGSQIGTDVETYYIPQGEQTQSGHAEYKATFTITAGTYIKARYNETIGEPGLIYTVNLRDQSALAWEFIEGKGLRCPATLEYTLFLVSSDGTNYDQVSIFMGGTEGANFFAITFYNKFCNSTDGICDFHGNTNLTNLKNAWGVVSDPTTKKPTGFTLSYNCLSEDAKTILQEASSASENENLRKFAELYDYIYRKYARSLLDNNDFANRFPGIKFQQGANRNWTKLESEDQTILIVVIASASLLTLSAGALAILLKKKKKHTND